MDADNAYNPAITDAPEQTDRQDELGIIDENAGQKIKDTADKVGVFGSIGALFLGLIIWDHSGFLLGFLFAGVCIVASCALYCLLYSYGDAVCIAVEQAIVLKKLEAEKNIVLPTAKQQPPESDMETVDDGSDDTEPGEPEDAGQDFAEDLLSAIEANHAETGKIKSDLPAEAYAFDQMKRIAHFAERSRFGAICPVCGKWQTTEDDTCFRCSCTFYFDDEKRDASRRTA